MAYDGVNRGSYAYAVITIIFYLLDRIIKKKEVKTGEKMDFLSIYQ